MGWAEEIISKTSAKVYDDKQSKTKLWACLLLTGGETLVRGTADLKHYAQLLGKGRAGISAIKKLVVLLNSNIDDRLDTMDPQDIIDAGAVHLGKTPCAFLMNPAIVTPEEWADFRNIARTGIISMDDLVIFGNLLAKMQSEQAAAAVKIRQDPWDMVARQEFMQKHLSTSELSIAMLAHIYKHDRFTKEDVDMEEIRHLYPKAAHLGKIFEYQDDICDVICDYAFELQTGFPTPNVVIGECMAILSALPATERSQRKQALDDFVRLNKERPTRIPLDEMPSELVEAIRCVSRRNEQAAQQLPPLPRKIAVAMIAQQLPQGIYGLSDTVRMPGQNPYYR